MQFDNVSIIGANYITASLCSMHRLEKNEQETASRFRDIIAFSDEDVFKVEFGISF